MLPELAWMVVVPVPTAVARPATLIVATVTAEELHVAVLLRFCVIQSLTVPVAVNCCVPPFGTEGFAGVTAIDTSVAAVTVSVVLPVMPLEAAWMVVVPVPPAVPKPAALIVATVTAEELHVAVLVRFCVVPSLKVPVAVNCRVPPFGTDGFAGVTAMDTSVAAVTVSVVLPVMPLEAAWMVVVPVPPAVPKPAALIVATVTAEELHVAVLVRFCVVPSLKVPVAVNCRVPPFGTDGFAGVTAMDTSVAAVTVSVVLPVMPLEAAWMVVVPVPPAVPKPAALIVATVTAEELHVAVLVRFCVVPSLKVPVAVNCRVPPFGTDGFAGVTAMDTSVAAVTVSVVLPVMPLEAAWMVVVPVPPAVPKPAALIVATVTAEELHVAVLVRFCVVPSLKVPVAVNCCVPPFGTDGFAGVTAMDTSVAAVTVSVVLPVMPLEAAWMVVVPVPPAGAKPAALIVATVTDEELHAAVLVRFCVVPSLKVPVAVNCCVPPFGTDGFAGVTAIDTSVAAVTVSVVLP